MIDLDQTTSASQKFQPADDFVISDLETLKVLADPLRLSILEYLYNPGTVKQVAAKVNKPPTKLYYHFNLLEKHGLIQMVDTRIVSGIIEKHYQASARLFRVERGLLSPGGADFEEGLDVTLSALFGDVRNDLRESIVAGIVDTNQDAPEFRRLLISHGRLCMTEEQAKDFYARMLSLIKEFEGEPDENDDQARSYKAFLMLHPTSRTVNSGD